jgi:hypothetical protein
MHVQFWAPCIDSFTIDVGSCCKEHDRAMWCSHNPDELFWVNKKVVACISTKVIAEGWRLLADIIKELPFPADILLGAMCGVLMAAWVVANLIIDAVMDLVYIGYNFDISALGKDRNYVNFDGRNNDSCLCGGTKPTILCSDANCCRDLCKEFPDTHTTEDCMDCGCVCDYDEKGRFIGTHFRNPSGTPDDDTGCCPGTARFTASGDPNPCMGAGFNPHAPCNDHNCIRCSECWYECIPKGFIGGKPAYDLELQKENPNIRCCKDPWKPPLSDCFTKGQIH